MSAPLTGTRDRFAHAVAEAITMWSELAEWQRLAIMAISPELADRFVEAEAATDALSDETDDQSAEV